MKSNEMRIRTKTVSR